MQLSLSGFLFEDEYTSQSVNFSRFCAIAKSAGYDGVELRDTQVGVEAPQRKRRELLKIVRNAGLFVTCLTARALPTAGPERKQAFLRYLELCQHLECRLLKIGGEPRWLREAAAKAEEYGVVLASNNHVGTMLESVVGTRRYFQEIAHANFRLLYDSLHLMVAGEDYLACIPEFLPITSNLLFHSARRARPGEPVLMEARGERWTRAFPGEPGSQDWASIFRSFKILGYDGLITVIESGWPEEQREDIARHCAELVRKLWNAA